MAKDGLGLRLGVAGLGLVPHEPFEIKSDQWTPALGFATPSGCSASDLVVFHDTLTKSKPEIPA